MNYFTGIATVPVSLALSELSTRIGKVAGCVNETYMQNLKRNFQSSCGYKILFTYLPSDRLPRFLSFQRYLVLSNQTIPLIEELVFRTGFQGRILPILFSACKVDPNTPVATIARIGLASVLFGGIHFINKNNVDLITEFKNTSRQRIMSPKEMKSALNRQIIGSTFRGILWGCLYERVGFMASWSSHAFTNYFFDAITERSSLPQET